MRLVREDISGRVQTLVAELDGSPAGAGSFSRTLDAMTELLLVGAGHAHLHVLQHASKLAVSGYRVHLLAPRYFDYSGVASATAAGALPAHAGRIDVRELVRDSPVIFHEGTLQGVDATSCVAVTSEWKRVPYDVLSLNVGSVVAVQGMTVDPSVLTVKPLSGLAALDDRLRAGGIEGSTVTVVGGGASGLELAAHLSVRAGVAGVQLIDSGPAVGAGLPPGARRRMEKLLASRGVTVRTGCAVEKLGERSVTCADGAVFVHDVALLATGLTAPPLLAELGLGDAHGVPVRATLQHVDHDDVYAAGDCAHFLESPLPRIGVHGVRQGPVLLASLLARMHGESLPAYRPQRRALSILDLGDGLGLAVYGRWWCIGSAPLWLKRRIDHRWLKTHQV